MTYSRGIFRLWIVVSVAWVALAAVSVRPDRSFTTYWAFRSLPISEQVSATAPQGEKPWKLPEGYSLRPGQSWNSEAGLSREELLKEGQRRRTRSIAELRSFATFAIIPPLVLLAFGVALAWVIRGFNRKPG